MNILEKIKNMIMAEEIEEEEIEEQEEMAETRQVVNGVPLTSPFDPPVRSATTRPRLSVCTTQTGELAVDIYVPTAFAQAARIADDLIAKKAAIVNYERVEGNEQRRLCDFINGVCYILDGEARRISDGMVLYVPTGVNVVTANAVAAKK